MPGFTEELVAIRSRLQQIHRSHVHQMLWEDPLRACQPYWDVAICASDADAGATDDEPERPLIVLSAKPYVEPRVHRSRTR